MMSLKFNHSILILLLFFSLNSYAEIVPLLELNNVNESSGKSDYPTSIISLELDHEGHLKQIRYGDFNAPQNEIASFDLNALNSRQGAIFEPDHEALVLFGKKIDPSSGGPLVMRHIYNGILNSYHHCPLELKRSNEGQWAVFLPGSPTSIRKATMVVYSIGIRDIRGFKCHK